MSTQQTAWNAITANTLRNMCRDLGFSWLSSREAMVTHLKIAFEEGPEEAREQASLSKHTRVSSPKRKAKGDDEDESPSRVAKRARRSNGATESASVGETVSARRTRAVAAAEETPRRSSRAKAPQEETPKEKKRPTVKRKGPKPGAKKAAPNSSASAKTIEAKDDGEADADANGNDEKGEDEEADDNSNKENDLPSQGEAVGASDVDEAPHDDADGSVIASENAPA